MSSVKQNPFCRPGYVYKFVHLLPTLTYSVQICTLEMREISKYCENDKVHVYIV